VFVKVNKKLLIITKTPLEYITEFITALKSFMIQVPEKESRLENRFYYSEKHV